MGMAFTADASSFREQMFFRVKKDSIHTIKFNYTDSSFNLVRSEDRWLVDGVPSDSTKTVEFLSKLSYTTSKNFVDDIDNFGEPVLRMTISANGEDDLILSGYSVAGRNIILSSSINPTAYFEDQALIDKFLKGKEYFRNGSSGD